MSSYESTISEKECILCIPLETLCFVFGVICCMLSVFGLMILTFAQVLGKPKFSIECHWDEETIATFGLMVFLYIYCISSFIFSFMLTYGAHARRSSFLKAYLVYGSVVTTLTVSGATVYFCFSWLLDIVGFTVVFVLCCIYTLLLVMVQRTYRQLQAEKEFYIIKLSEYLGR